MSERKRPHKLHKGKKFLPAEFSGAELDQRQKTAQADAEDREKKANGK